MPEPLLQHRFRLDILCCLVDESLSLTALSARLGKPAAAVAYHLGVLGDRDLVERVEGIAGKDALYAASLDGHQPWVAEAVSDHKQPDSARPDSLPTVEVMVGMKCDGCERLFRHEDQVVGLYEEDGVRWARLVTEASPGSGETANRRATEKYHRDCYAQARERDALLPPIPG
jgi:DNA-binding transcriptional ArsR family regulator